MDVLRLLRAVHVQEIDRIESMRKLALQHDRAKLEPEDWRAIRRHDRLLAHYYAGEVGGDDGE